MAFVNKGKVRILRGNLNSGNENDVVGNTTLWDGQPFYDKQSGKLFVGNGDGTKIKDTNPINAGHSDTSDHAEYSEYTGNSKNCDSVFAYCKVEKHTGWDNSDEDTQFYDIVLDVNEFGDNWENDLGNKDKKFIIVLPVKYNGTDLTNIKIKQKISKFIFVKGTTTLHSLPINYEYETEGNFFIFEIETVFFMTYGKNSQYISMDSHKWENAVFAQYSITQDVTDNSTKIATTAYIHNLLDFKQGDIKSGSDVVGKIYYQRVADKKIIWGYINTNLTIAASYNGTGRFAIDWGTEIEIWQDNKTYQITTNYNLFLENYDITDSWKLDGRLKIWGLTFQYNKNGASDGDHEKYYIDYNAYNYLISSKSVPLKITFSLIDGAIL